MTGNINFEAPQNKECHQITYVYSTEPELLEGTTVLWANLYTWFRCPSSKTFFVAANFEREVRLPGELISAHRQVVYMESDACLSIVCPHVLH